MCPLAVLQGLTITHELCVLSKTSPAGRTFLFFLQSRPTLASSLAVALFKAPSFTSYVRRRISKVLISVKNGLIASQERCTCSIQGEKEHRTPSCLSIVPADGIASQGWGKSKNTASAAPQCSSGNPSPCMSRTATAIRLLSPFFSKSSLAEDALWSW